MKIKFYNFLQPILFAAIATTGFAQTDNGQAMANLRADIIPHSPEAEAMAKYGVLPVTLYSGLPSITVPIFEIKTPNLDLPFSLSYNYNGYKPNEIPSWAGMGWSVQGGGSITRIVKGQVDESMGTNAHYDDYVAINALVWNQSFLTKIAMKQIDPEPDIYLFNVGGYSGKFILIKGKAYIFPYQNIKITPYLTNGFKLVDDKGNSYTFYNYETTYQKTLTTGSFVPTHTSCWYVSQIISANKKDTVLFDYTAYSYHEPDNYIENYTINGSQGTGLNTAGHSYIKYSIEGNHIDALFLTRVTSRYGGIYFSPSATDRQDLFGSTGAKYLDYINITNSDGTYNKQLKLNHGYFGTGYNMRLNLQSVVIKHAEDPATDISQYSFQYAGPTGTLPYNGTTGIDMFGYYNGKNNNAMLFPSGHFTPSIYSYGDRTADIQYSQIGILNQITYPTGGYSKLVYEQNKAGSGNALIDGPGLRIKSISTYNSDCTTQFIKQYTYDNGHGLATGGISGSNLYADCSQYYITTYSAGIKSALSEFSEEQFFYAQVEESTQDYKQGKTRYTYRSVGGLQRDVKLISQTDYQFNGTSYLPVKDLTNEYQDVLMNNFSVTEVLPVTVVGDKTCVECLACNPLQSPDPTQALDPLTIYGTTGYSSAQSIYTELSSETHTEYNNLGQATLQNSINYFYDNPNHLFPTRIVNRDSKGQQFTTYLKYPLDYTLGQTSSPTSINSAFIADLGAAMNGVGNCVFGEQTALQPYQPFHGNTATNQQHFITIANQYNCQTGLLTDIASAITNRNTALSNYLSFLNTSISTNSVAWQKGVLWMQANNIISPVIEKYTTFKKADGNDYLVSATRNEYNILTNSEGVQAVFQVGISQAELRSPLLLSAFTANPDASYKPQVTFGYDGKFNLAFQNKPLDKKIAYLWDYQNSYPIAQLTAPGIIDMAYTSFEAEGMGNWQLNNGSINSGGGITGRMSYNLGGTNSISRTGLVSSNYIVSYWLKNGTGTPTVNGSIASTNVIKPNWTLYSINLTGITSVSISGTGIIDELRLYPAGAEMTTNTYKPLAGISSECDINNHITYYTYDDVGRLMVVQDQDNNILKSYSYNYAGPPSCTGIFTNQQPHSKTYTRKDCDIGEVGSEVVYYVPIGAYSSTISQTDAEQKAGNDVDINGQIYANLNGTCTVYVCSPANCSGVATKCVNNICETGVRFNVSTIYIKAIAPGSPPGSVATFYWRCTWHYQWSDGSVGTDNYEYNSSPCTLGCDCILMN